MEDAGSGLFAMAVALAVLVLLALGVLMPWFVYRISSHVKAIRQELGTIERSVRAAVTELRQQRPG